MLIQRNLKDILFSGEYRRVSVICCEFRHKGGEVCVGIHSYMNKNNLRNTIQGANENGHLLGENGN